MGNLGQPGKLGRRGNLGKRGNLGGRGNLGEEGQPQRGNLVVAHMAMSNLEVSPRCLTLCRLSFISYHLKILDACA